MLAILAVASALTLAAVTAPIPALLRVLQDDGFYYVGIAVNWIHGHPSTFDGIQSTNGYHPLWQFVAVVVAWLLREPERVARGLMVVGIWMVVAASFRFEAYLRRTGSPLAIGALLWMTCAILPAPIYGMETALAILACALCVSAWPVGLDEYSARRGLLCGITSSLLFLARLDTVPFLAAMTVVATVTAPIRSRWTFALPLIVFQTSCVLGALLTNWRIWGHLATVSMLAKAGRTPLFHPWRIHVGTLLGLGLIASLASLIWLIRVREEWRRPARPPGAAMWLALGGLAYMAFIVCTGGVETYGWYFGVVAASGAVLIPLALDSDRERGPERRGRGMRGVAAACALAAVWVAALTWIKPVTFVRDYRIARVLARFPAGQMVFAATDCGIRGSLSRQHCLNLDGLTGSYEFQEALRDDRFAEWLRRAGLNTYVGPVGHVPGSPTARAVLESRPGMNGVARAARLTLLWPARYEDADAAIYTVLAIERARPEDLSNAAK